MRVRKWPRTHQDLPATLPSGSETIRSIDLSQKPSVGAAKYQKVVLDYDAAGNRAGIDIDHAGHTLDLRELIRNQLPLAAKALFSAARSDLRRLIRKPGRCFAFESPASPPAALRVTAAWQNLSV